MTSQLTSTDVTSVTQGQTSFGLVAHDDQTFITVWSLNRVLQLDASMQLVGDVTTSVSNDVLFSLAVAQDQQQHQDAGNFKPRMQQ